MLVGRTKKGLLGAAGLAAGACVLVGALASGAGAAANRATPQSPKKGAEFREGKPGVKIQFRWGTPKGHAAKRIEVSESKKTEQNGSFRKTVNAKKLGADASRATLGIRDPGHYHWHVATVEDGKKVWGPRSSFVVLATLSRSEATLYTRDMLKSRINAKVKLRNIDCDRQSRMASRCKFRGKAGGFKFSGRGTTYLSRRAPDNFRYYHYDYKVVFVDPRCVAENDGRVTRKCTDKVRWKV